MQGLIGPLKELAEFEELCKNKKKDAGMIRVCGCVNSQKSHMMYAIGDGCKYKVIACSSETKAKQIYEEYRFLDNNTYLYPAKDFLFYKADIRSKELVNPGSAFRNTCDDCDKSGRVHGSPRTKREY